MNDPQLLEKIQNIIEDIVCIDEGNYGWAGQEYILTNVYDAADAILELLDKEGLI